MAIYLLDTTTITHIQYNHPRVLAALTAHALDTISISSVNMEEMLGGWIRRIPQSRTPRDEAIASVLLTESVIFLAGFSLVPITDVAINRYETLRRMKLNVGRNDLRLAACALELDAIVATNNIRDFGRVPGLKWVDWTK